MPKTATKARKAEPKRRAGKPARKKETPTETTRPQQPIPPTAILPSTPQPSIPRVEEKLEEPRTAGMAPIKAHEFDTHFKRELGKIHGAENLKRCFQCGTCTSDCPIARYSDTYRPRQIIRMAQLGLRDRVLKSDMLWLCAACFTCTDRCPQDVEVASVIRVLRNAAVERGIMPPIFKELGSSILDTGVAYRIPELRLRKRKETGLPPLPKANPEVLIKLASLVGFLKLVKGEDA